MKKTFQNFIIFFFTCCLLNACASSDVTNTKAEKQTKKKFINFTPPEKNIDNNKGTKLSDLLNLGGDKVGSVNKYLWQASIEVLNFLPIKTADPFSGIISFDKGSAPGSSQVYDATVYISDAALDARSLNVTVRDTNGRLSFVAEREIENAILTRARQLRINALNM